MIPGARFEVMDGCGHWPQYEDAKTFNAPAHRLPAGPRSERPTDVDVLIVGAGPVGLTLANVLGLQGVRTLVVDERDSLIDYPRGVGLDDEALRTFQSIGARRARAAAHRAQPDPALLRRQSAPARRNGAARRTIRLAQAQRLRPADGRRRTAARAGALRLRRGGVERADGVVRGDRRRRHRRDRRAAGPSRHRALRRRLRRRAQRDAASDGGDVRGHHRRRRAGWSSTSRPIRSATPTARSAPIPPGRTPRSRSHTEFAASSS